MTINSRRTAPAAARRLAGAITPCRCATAPAVAFATTCVTACVTALLAACDPTPPTGANAGNRRGERTHPSAGPVDTKAAHPGAHDGPWHSPAFPAPRYLALGDLEVDLAALSAAQRTAIERLLGPSAPPAGVEVVLRREETDEQLARMTDALLALLTPAQRASAVRVHGSIHGSIQGTHARAAVPAGGANGPPVPRPDATTHTVVRRR